MKAFILWKHCAQKIIAVDILLTYKLHARIVEKNTVTVDTITTLFSYELVNLSRLVVI